eukprot:10841580-Lingulodinium_polyedra.AAC.1
MTLGRSRSRRLLAPLCPSLAARVRSSRAQKMEQSFGPPCLAPQFGAACRSRWKRNPLTPGPP